VEEKEATSVVPSIDRKGSNKERFALQYMLSFATDYPMVCSQFAL
jgi:hypothetical protein